MNINVNRFYLTFYAISNSTNGWARCARLLGEGAFVTGSS
jgi:hypothetical protein